MKLKNVGKDVPIETNKKGGKQSTTAYAMHLIDPEFLISYGSFTDEEWDVFLKHVAAFMMWGDKCKLLEALKRLYFVESPSYLLFVIGEVLKEGAEKYAPNNWRLIPQEEHLNHALIHYLAYKTGNTEDNHKAHCACRIMMAYATKPTEGFKYTEPLSITKSS